MDDFIETKLSRRDLLIVGALSATGVAVPSIAGAQDGAPAAASPPPLK